MVSWTVVSEQICDLIKDETGITIDPSELNYQRGEELKVLLFGSDFASIDVDYLDESDDDEGIAYVIVESVDSLAKRVTENRIKYLEGTIQPIIDEVMHEKGVKLSYEIENRGYMGRARHYLNESEYERDYPDLVILIRGGKKIVELPLDPYQADEPFDVFELKEKL